MTLDTDFDISAPGIEPGDEGLLLRLLEGTMSATGEAFFQSLVRNLSIATESAHAFVAAPCKTPGRVRTIAVWALGKPVENYEYELAGTPCEEVLRGRLCHHPRNVQGTFPSDHALVDLGVESYLGIPLVSPSGEAIGHLAILDTRPMSDEPRRLSIFKIFASRAAAELRRLDVEHSLRKSEGRFRDLFEEAPIAYVYEDTETRFVSANRAFTELLGLTPEEVPGMLGRSLVAPAVQNRVDETFADIQKGKPRGEIELELRRKDNGKPVWVQFWSRPEPDGEHTRTMLIDITDRVLAERERNRLRAHNAYLREELEGGYKFERIVGGSTSLSDVLVKVRQVAPTTSTVLVLGETGTGKELVARAIHSCSKRADRPFIKLNCAALPTGLIESELFGHEKGAFTGALEKRVGRFTLADGGTIFLDEIGDIPLDVQVRLLRVLQEQEFEPVGSATTVKVDVRVIAATNRNLEKAVDDGSFRADLYYRLNVFPLEVPPLRQRPEDISLLAAHFVEKYAAKIGRSFEGIEPDTLARLSAYRWPGNIRELENIIERAVILSAGPLLRVDPEVISTRPTPAATSPRPASPGTTAVDHERAHILDTLERSNWIIDGPRGAAKALGLHPNTLRSRMKKLGIQRAHEGS